MKYPWSDEEHLFVEVNFHLMTITELQAALLYEFDIERSVNSIKTYAYRIVKVSRNKSLVGQDSCQDSSAPERTVSCISRPSAGVTVHRLI